MNTSKHLKTPHRWLRPWWIVLLTGAGLAGAAFALSDALESDSDGKTSSADYICTGPVWTIDENGVRTDNTFDEAKRLKTSTRHGARGDVVTTYTYDADGRVVAETKSAGALTQTTSRTYHADGSLATETDALGNVVETLLGEAVFNRFNDAGEEDSVTRLETASPTWRKTATESVYEKDASGIIWQKTTNTVSCSDATIPAQTTISKTQLSGLSLALESKQISTDLRGNETVTTSAYAPATKTRTQTTAFPQMTDVQTSVTVDGVVTSQTAPSGVTTSAVYDAFNRRTASTDTRGNATLFTYDALGRTVSVTDASGTTTKTYDAYGALVSESVGGLGGKTLTRHYDGFGRDLGYSVGNARKATLAYDAASGRLVSMSADDATFSWEYLAGTHLKSKLTYPNAATAEWTYAADRDLLIRVKNTVNGGVISQYDYANDALGRRTSMTRSGTLMATSGEALAYGYNARSELTSAVSDSDTNYNYAYAFDHIGNRQSATEVSVQSTYSANSLNQYSEILRGEATLMSLAENPSSGNSFTPEYDADGNATKIRTSTGTWNITYNAENRPVRWENTDTGTVITMAFDSQGRRVEYKSETNGVQNSWLRFFYKDYLCVQVLYSKAPYNVHKEFLWDPTEPVATRPLWFKYAGKNLFYAHDRNKNVSDLFYRATQNGVGAHYDYAPFGAITRTAKSSSLPTDILNENPFHFSSEYYDSELGLVYYNFLMISLIFPIS